METSPFGILVIVAFVLLVGVSAGIVYLTIIEWRDRRRRDQESREQRISSRSSRKAQR